MNRVSGFLAFTAALFITGCATPPPPKPTAEELFKGRDVNGDGRVSRPEHDSYLIGEMFTRYDKNNDSVISQKEYLDNGGTAEGFRKIDTSGSGKVSLKEAKASPGVRKTLDGPFEEADVNRDGRVSLDEFRTSREKTLDYVR